MSWKWCQKSYLAHGLRWRDSICFPSFLYCLLTNKVLLFKWTQEYVRVLAHVYLFVRAQYWVQNMDFTWKRIYNYMFGVFSCMVQGKDWYGTHTFTAQCTQNNMEHPFCIKEVVQQRELLRFHSQQDFHRHWHTLLNFPINSFIWTKNKKLHGEFTGKFTEKKVLLQSFWEWLNTSVMWV